MFSIFNKPQVLSPKNFDFKKDSEFIMMLIALVMENTKYKMNLLRPDSIISDDDISSLSNDAVSDIVSSLSDDYLSLLLKYMASDDAVVQFITSIVVRDIVKLSIEKNALLLSK